MSARGVIRWATFAAPLALAAAASWPATASAEQAADSWQGDAPIYLWMPEITGAANLRGGNSADIDVKFHTLLDSLKFAGMGTLAVQNGEWGGFTDIIFMNLGASKTTTRDGTIDGVPLPAQINLKTDLGLKAWIWTLAANYRLKAEPDSTLDVFAGTRLLWLQPKLEYTFSADVGPFVGPGRSGSRSVTGQSWDGIVGLKGRTDFGDEHKWFFSYYLDAGAGDSQFTWQGSAGVGYRFHWGDLIASWRYLDYSMKSGKKLDDLTINGPLLGATFHW